MKTNARIIMVDARTNVSTQWAATSVLAEKDFCYSETSTVAKRVRPFMMTFWVLTQVYNSNCFGIVSKTRFTYKLLQKQWTLTTHKVQLHKQTICRACDVSFLGKLS